MSQICRNCSTNTMKCKFSNTYSCKYDALLILKPQVDEDGGYKMSQTDAGRDPSVLGRSTLIYDNNYAMKILRLSTLTECTKGQFFDP